MKSGPVGLQHVVASGPSEHVGLAQSVVVASSIRPLAPWSAQKVSRQVVFACATVAQRSLILMVLAQYTLPFVSNQ